MKNSSNTNYMQILGIVTQMVAIMALGFWAGNYFDEKAGDNNHLYTMLLGFSAMIGAIILTVVRVNKIFDNKENENQ